MESRKLMITLSLLLPGLLCAAVLTSAEGIKARMKARLPMILELKAKGLIGENFDGYLEVIGNHKENEDVIQAENSDRRQVYEAIAKQQGTTAELVGRRRALQIAQNANSGEWLQEANGKWYQKK